MSLVATSSVLAIDPDSLESSSRWVEFTSYHEEDKLKLRRAVTITRSDWEELGQPDKITIRIEPGDKLNY